MRDAAILQPQLHSSLRVYLLPGITLGRDALLLFSWVSEWLMAPLLALAGLLWALVGAAFSQIPAVVVVRMGREPVDCQEPTETLNQSYPQGSRMQELHNITGTRGTVGHFSVPRSSCVNPPILDIWFGSSSLIWGCWNVSIL